MDGAYFGRVVVEKAERGERQGNFRKNQFFAKFPEAGSLKDVLLAFGIAGVHMAPDPDAFLAVKAGLPLGIQSSKGQDLIPTGDGYIGDGLLEIGLGFGPAALDEESSGPSGGEKLSLDGFGGQGTKPLKGFWPENGGTGNDPDKLHVPFLAGILSLARV